MDKILLLLMITLLFFTASCSSPSKKNINHLLDTKMEDVKVKDTSLPEIVIVQKLNYLMVPLFVGLFAGIFLIVSGVRAIGFAVLVASIACILLIITLAVHMKLIGAIGIIVLLVGVFFIGKNAYDNYRFKKDMVKTVETSKEFISDEDKEILSKRLDKEQSKTTKKVVKEIKNKKLGEKKNE